MLRTKYIELGVLLWDFRHLNPRLDSILVQSQFLFTNIERLCSIVYASGIWLYCMPTGKLNICEGNKCISYMNFEALTIYGWNPNILSTSTGFLSIIPKLLGFFGFVARAFDRRQDLLIYLMHHFVCPWYVSCSTRWSCINSLDIIAIRPTLRGNNNILKSHSRRLCDV